MNEVINLDDFVECDGCGLDVDHFWHCPICDTPCCVHCEKECGCYDEV